MPRGDALKVLSEAITADSNFRERFQREADLAAALWHPNIVAVHDRGEFDGHLWIAMDYVDGTDAAQLVKDRYPAGMPVQEVCDIVTTVAAALDYAHSRGLLHRDVKPANILLTQPENGKQRILLADFGIARPLADISGLTVTNFTVGTLAYAAPEQLWVQTSAAEPINMRWRPQRFTFSLVGRRISIPTPSPSSADISLHPCQS